jgi:hypothetical protein
VRHRVGLWRDAKAFEVHAALMSLRAAGHAIDVCLARLIRLMAAESGYRRWGTVSFASYIIDDLRQRSPRRFRYLVAIDRAIVERPLPKLGEAWRRGSVTVAQARELIRVMRPDNEHEWLEAAACMSVWKLQQVVKRALEGEAEADGGARGGGEALAPEGRALDDEERHWRRKVFSSTRPVDAAWQVALETSRRMAGLDLPVHECVDDILAEYASGSPVTPIGPDTDGAAQDGTGARGSWDDEAEDEPGGWRRAVRWAAEALEEVELLRRVEREVRLAADPLEGLDGARSPDPADLHRRIRWLLRIEQGIAWHECRLLRLMADLNLHQRLGFRSLRQYATEAMGAGDRRPWGQVALARQLDRFPKVGDSFRTGRISALEAAEICRVARGGTQDAWVARARTSTLAALREDVAFVLWVDEESGLPPARPLGGGVRPCAELVAGRDWCGRVGQDPREAERVQTCAHRTSSVEAVPLARRVEGWYSAFGEDPGAVAAQMLSDGGRKRPVMFFAPQTTSAQWDLTLAYCRASEGDGEALSDSRCVALLLLSFLGVWAHPRFVKESRGHRILTRDGWRCQVPRCRSRAHLHAHHVVFRSRGGPDADWNVVTVCAVHHRMIHAGVIQVRGRAPGGLEWAMGVNAAGDVRERFRNGTRVECDASWSLEGA